MPTETEEKPSPIKQVTVHISEDQWTFLRWMGMRNKMTASSILRHVIDDYIISVQAEDGRKASEIVGDWPVGE